MKNLIIVLAAALLFTVVNAEEKKFDEAAFLASLKDRYTLGIIHQDYNHEKNIYRYDEVSGGLVIIKMSPESEIYKQGVKSGWVFLSVDKMSLAENGQDTFFKRLQDKELSDDLEFEIFDGKKIRKIVLTRTKTRYPILEYVEVR